MVSENVTLYGGFDPPFDVSGDGKYAFFVSIADIDGQNPTKSEQLFMAEVETRMITQLTDRQAANPEDGSLGARALQATWSDGSVLVAHWMKLGTYEGKLQTHFY